MLTIDGAQGEGGGQIVRTSLALSVITGTPFRGVNLRARRDKPGLRRQHLTAVQAAAAISGATVEGAAVSSREITFRPGPVVPGSYTFSIGTAGSATLVCQTVLPALVRAGAASALVLEGGTHNEHAPPFDFLDRAYLPLLRRMGAGVTATLDRHGFYPAGGGRFRVAIEPVLGLARLDLLERGALVARRARTLSSKIPAHVGEREAAVIGQELGWPQDAISRDTVDAFGPGNAVVLEVEHEQVTEVFSAVGRRGVPAEQVAHAAVAEAGAYLASGAPIGTHLADQLLLPLALAGGGSFRSLAPTPHTTTQADVIRRFLDVPIAIEQESGAVWRVVVGPSPV
jgi:RNA 3'-terminal phosphate cyclase (ATP)